MIYERIQHLRENSNMTQVELAKRLGITRSSVNAWEQGISCPSTTYLVELARIFHVSTDYLLGINSTATIDVSGLSDKDVEILQSLSCHLRSLHNTS